MFFITCIVLLVAAKDTLNERYYQYHYHQRNIKPTKSTFYGWRHEEGGSYEGGSDQLSERNLASVVFTAMFTGKMRKLTMNMRAPLVTITLALSVLLITRLDQIVISI